MTLLWAGFALLLALAVWWLVLPLRQARCWHEAIRRREAEHPRVEDHVQAFQHRLAALEQAHERGALSAAAFDADRLELERELLDGTESAEPRPLKAAHAGKPLVPVLMIVVVLVSAWGYHQLGAVDNLALRMAQQQVVNGPAPTTRALIEAMEAQAERQADNPEVWRALFPLYRDSGRFGEAENALQHLIDLQGRRPALLAEMAELRYFAAGRRMTPGVQSLLDAVLAEVPGQPTALGVMGIEAFQQGQYQQAIEHWRQAVAGMPDGRVPQALKQGIDAARQRLAAGAASPSGTQGKTSAGSHEAPVTDSDKVVE